MVSYQHEFAVPEPRAELLAYARQTTRHAVERSLYHSPGPVHLNCPFRDPLPPVRDEDLTGLAALIGDEGFWSHLAPVQRPAAPLLAGVPALPASGLIVAGPTEDFSQVRCAEIATLARRLGWPVLADALSPLRQYTGALPALVTHYDAVLRSPALAARLTPAAVLVIDALPTSKVLRSWLGSLQGVPAYHLSLHPENRDALHASSVHLRGDVAGLLAALPPGEPAPCLRCALWRRADAAARGHLLDSLLAEILPVEPRASWELSRLLPKGTPVFVANSMPVRDLEYFWGPEGRELEVYFNRGANGIDGTLSTALGVAREGRPAVLVTGDLSLLHDSNGFLLHARIESSLTILLINNHGGGIFGHLAVAGFNPPFEEYFATPQNVDFAALASAHQVPYERVRDWAHFEELFSRLPARGVRLLELRTERHHDALLRKQLFASAAVIAEKACAD
jgi:2-succinyl-5-enolpyruvyl-6-hydroxy-3-cyclohexene-1-carboxylate synthase